MNQIRQIQTLNKRELEAGIYDPAASWHADYRDTAFVNFGGLPYNLTEGDILAIFSQYGEPVWLKLARDKETGKSKGFGWLKYEDQRSCDLAVDNLGGAEIAGRLVRVDHARYKARDDEDDSEFRVGWDDLRKKERRDKGEKSESETEEEEEQVVRRPMIKEERELQKLIAEHDEDDPMKAFLIEEKRREVDEGLRREEKKDKKHKHKHHHRSHRSRRDEEDGHDDRGKKRSRRDETPVAHERRRGATPDARERDGHQKRDRRHRDDDHNGERQRDRRRHHDDEDHERERRRDKDRRREGEGSADHESRRDRRRERDGDNDRDRRSYRRSRSPRQRGDR
ncbi:hypothetical protein BKA67DRAFT_527906 [Truncatella angustata]|uniref:RRM domain-containing protein n=1 Tax=Truncatella angustata TaxID=152316 RepID=A0A9P8RIN1_9PEZI|nr:uncharacterized protein BKA67DRAFT_527906 [Truncatella angustata]KAH6643405.1 hypothetical protein BKA67DRAFT_527906 [Truncatella angustata]